MSAKFFTLLRGTATIFAVLSGSMSHSQEKGQFRSVEEARVYLAENPTGPRSRDAFRYLMGQKVASQYHEYPRDGRIPGVGRSVTRSTKLTANQIAATFDEVSKYY